MNDKSLSYRTLHGMLWGYIGKFLEFAIMFVFSIVVGRTLGPVVYGRYNLFISTITTFVLFSSLGFDSVLSRFIPQLKAEGKTADVYSLFQTVFLGRFFIIGLLGIIVWISSSFLANFFSEEILSRYSVFFVLIMLGLGIQDLLVSFFNALLKLKEIAVVQTISLLFRLAIIVLLFIYIDPSLKAILQAVLFSLILSIVLFLFISLKLVPERKKNILCDLRPYLRFGFYTWQTAILTYAISNTLNVILMGRIIKDPLQIGFYSVAILFSYLPGNLIVSWSKIILPAISEAKTKHGMDGVSEAFICFNKVIFIMLIPILLFLGRYAGVLVISLFGEKFIPSILLIRVYVLFSLIGVLAAPKLAASTLYALDKEKLVLKIRFFSGVLNIGLVLLLAFPFKALGVMLAGSTAILFQTIIDFFMVKKYVPIKYPFKYLFKITFSGVIALLFFAWIPVQGLISVIIVGILYFVIIFVVFHFVKLLNSEDKEFLSRIHPTLAAIVRYL